MENPELKRNLQALAGRCPKNIGEERMFHSAVCIPLIETDDGYDVLLEVRSSAIPDQPGDVCLPGGAMEAGETPCQTAVRETCEELLITPDCLRILGQSDTFYVGSTIVYPWAAVLSGYRGTYSSFECAGVFRVPLAYFLTASPERYPVDFVPVLPDNFPFDRIVGGKNYRWRAFHTEQVFYEYGGHTIWGITAKILCAFAELLNGGRAI